MKLLTSFQSGSILGPVLPPYLLALEYLMSKHNVTFHFYADEIQIYKPFIHLLYYEAGAYLQQSTDKRRGTPWIGCQSIQHKDIQGKQPCTHSFTLMGNLERPINLTVWEGARVSSENPRMHRKNKQAPCRKTPGRESNPGPSCCKVTVLPTAPQCRLIMQIYKPVKQNDSNTLGKVVCAISDNGCHRICCT
ncbi:hypothetical protein AMECASPLE_030454 [Ameca splendens]|uniref:Reverse transcriptase domain-containing protein n=1 Tax=Ameca splendens TaxID=208324 RepID=A0ABV1ACF5_9TELE